MDFLTGMSQKSWKKGQSLIDGCLVVHRGGGEGFVLMFGLSKAADIEDSFVFEDLGAIFFVLTQKDNNPLSKRVSDLYKHSFIHLLITLNFTYIYKYAHVHAEAASFCTSCGA